MTGPEISSRSRLLELSKVWADRTRIGVADCTEDVQAVAWAASGTQEHRCRGVAEADRYLRAYADRTLSPRSCREPEEVHEGALASLEGKPLEALAMLTPRTRFNVRPCEIREEGYEPRTEADLSGELEARGKVSPPRNDFDPLAYGVNALVLGLVLSLAACGPSLAADAGEGFGETGGDLPIPGEIVDCRDMGQAIQCWVEWEGTYAEVWLECQRQALVDLNLWTSSYDPATLPAEDQDPDLAEWGPSVFCHDSVISDATACFYAGNVLLSKTLDGWVPNTNSTIMDYPIADLPCEDAAAGDGDGDPGGDGRLRLVEFVCDVDDLCRGRWEGTALWSLVSDAAEVDGSVAIPHPWGCTPTVDVDVCVVVDQQGHVGCFWYQDGWAVAVAPSCAVSGDPWLDVGNDMRSSAV